MYLDFLNWITTNLLFGKFETTKSDNITKMELVLKKHKKYNYNSTSLA